MKSIILISMLCIAATGCFAQENMKVQTGSIDNAVCKKYPGMPAGAVPVWPNSPYIAKGNPDCAPCYTYTTKHGLAVMECPGLWFLPENANKTNDHPKVCKRDPDMPVNAKPAWPVSPYVATQAPECAPCYTYTSKHGTERMECPYLRFLPEDAEK